MLPALWHLTATESIQIYDGTTGKPNRREKESRHGLALCVVFVVELRLLFRTLVHGNDFETLSSTKYTKYAKILDT
ncbi:MAG: hypothetical protein IJJ26_06710, partial [Victivallales bacterium]|nr:hypothetical protein [Victivallales bacterium]